MLHARRSLANTLLPVVDAEVLMLPASLEELEVTEARSAIVEALVDTLKLKMMA